jgi:hypothetical protein
VLTARLLEIGIAGADAKVSLFQGDKPLKVIVLRITCDYACFVNGGGYRILFRYRSPGTHCDGVKSGIEFP